MNSLSTAVILLAGNAPRYQDETGLSPSGLLEAEGYSLLELSVERLLKAGFTKILIITSQLPKSIQKLTKTAGITVRHDALFADFGSMFALRRAASAIPAFPFVLFEGGTIFEARLALLAKATEHPNAVLVSENPRQRSEIQATAVNQRLLSLTVKNSYSPWTESSQGLYTSMGIYKISQRMFGAMLAFAAERIYSNPFLDYTECIDGILPHIEVNAVAAPELLWAQIHNQSEMALALNQLYPRILQQEEFLRYNKTP